VRLEITEDGGQLGLDVAEGRDHGQHAITLDRGLALHAMRDGEHDQINKGRAQRRLHADVYFMASMIREKANRPSYAELAALLVASHLDTTQHCTKAFVHEGS
jgi:hypothetical protein